MVQIPRVPSRGSARTLPKTASYIFLLSMTSRRGGARTQTLAKDSARASLLKPNLAHHARFSRALAQRLGTCCSGPSTSRARDAVPRRDSRRGASHGGVPVRALRPRARVRDVAREPALRPSCVPNPRADLRPFLPDLMMPTLRLTRTNTSRPVNIRLTTPPRPTHPSTPDCRPRVHRRHGRPGVHRVPGVPAILGATPVRQVRALPTRVLLSGAAAAAGVPQGDGQSEAGGAGARAPVLALAAEQDGARGGGGGGGDDDDDAGGGRRRGWGMKIS